MADECNGPSLDGWNMVIIACGFIALILYIFAPMYELYRKLYLRWTSCYDCNRLFVDRKLSSIPERREGDGADKISIETSNRSEGDGADRVDISAPLNITTSDTMPTRQTRMPLVRRLFHGVLPYRKEPRDGLSITLPKLELDLDRHRCNREMDGSDVMHESIVCPTVRKPVLETEDSWNLQSNWETESSFSGSSASSASKHNIVRLSNFKKPYESCVTADMVQSIACIAESVGALIYKDTLIGTVFRVGSDYAMTAQHVFDKVKDPSNLKHAFVVFTNRIIGRSKFREEFEIYSDPVSLQALDIAVFRLKGDSTKLPPPLQLSLETPTCNKKECLIGYGNAETENVKSVDSNCSIISPNSLRVTDMKRWMESNRDSLEHNLSLRNIDPNIINQSYSGIDDNNRLLLDTSMIFGASGSPIIEIQNDTESTAKVVGVFTHGHPEFVYLLPVMERNYIPKELMIEVGTKSSAIFTKLKKLEMYAVVNELFFKKAAAGITDMVIP